MPEKNIDTSEAFDFGIVDTSVMGNVKAVDAFLSDTVLPDDDKELEDVDEEEKPPTKKEAVAKKAKETPSKSVVKKVEDPLKKTAEEILFEEKDEEDEEDKEEEEKEEKDEDKEESKEGNDFETLSKDLISLGVFTQEEDEALPKTGPELLAKFNAEKQKGATQWLDGFLGRFGDDRKDLFEAIFVNGVDPQEYLPVFAEVQNLESLDLSKEENQERVYREFYRRLKFSPENIDKKLQKAKDYGDLEEESKNYHAQIVAQDKEVLADQEASRAAKIQADARADAEYKSSIQKVLQDKLKTKEFNGIPLTPDLVNKAFDLLYTKRYKTADGQLLTEFDKFILETKRPENLEKRIQLALLKLTDFDFSKIAKRAVSKETNELFNQFAQQKAKKSTAVKEKATQARDWLQL
jgi:hypothetical protein